jgi:hypothetical protein
MSSHPLFLIMVSVAGVPFCVFVWCSAVWHLQKRHHRHHSRRHL